MKFLKIKNYWWELDGARVYNSAGGYHSSNSYDKSKAIEAVDWEYLDWKGTVIYNNEFKTGWINRDGIFYGCEEGSHYEQAEYVHHKTTRQLELLGWIKLYKSPYALLVCSNGLSIATYKHRLNELQINTLIKLGFTESEIDLIILL